ncbi:hypothetical protein EDD63_10822 [Breznakia blatticola]|uniref:Uncharacterized protein n=1 Tax=Breznakia blatticola TaxID=1754012 RepID=A0A4R8A297_9FIRM|nr:hypothetical protein [Breznakia blatticola]TDW24669.1 hypothetical protein EDD63_10822 [Breznakia blatticola]
MIKISCPMKQDFIIEIVEGIDKYKYTFEKKEGINLFFAVDAQDMEDAIATAKAAIKATEIGSVLYFSVSVA